MSNETQTHPLTTLKNILDALDPLTPEDRQRVVFSVVDFYRLPAVPTSVAGAPAVTEDVGDESVLKGRETKSMESSFADFPDLFSRAGARTKRDQVLLAAYWLRTSEGKDAFASSEVSRLLFDVGCKIKNITTAINGLVGKDPSLLMQVSTIGKGRRARKTYRVTAPGIKAAENIIHGSG